MNNKRAFEYVLAGSFFTSIGTYYLARNAYVAAKPLVKEIGDDLAFARAARRTMKEAIENDLKFVEITSQLEKW